MRGDSSYLTLHRVCVDLAHVSARVIGLDVADVQLPSVMVIVCDGQPRI